MTNIDELIEEAKSLREGKSEEDKITREVIYFLLEKEYYAVELTDIREIVGKMPVYPVPGTEEHILGLINLRGEVIPVIDLKLRLNLSKTDLKKYFQIIVIKAFEEPLAMIVDKVEDIAEVSEISSTEETFLKGKMQIKGKIVGLLDLKKIFYLKHN